MIVKFLQPCQLGSLYNKGETAGFEKDVAERLIDQGYAAAAKTEPKKSAELAA